MDATSAPTLIIGPTFSAIDASTVVGVVAGILFVLWLVYTLIAAYHWLRYGYHSPLAIPALAVHAFVSLAIAAFAVSGFA